MTRFLAALVVSALLVVPARAGDVDAADLAEAAALRAETAADRSEAAATRVEHAIERLERLLEAATESPAPPAPPRR